MSVDQPDTILAPATALGGGVAILRVSGPLSSRILNELSGMNNPTPRQAVLAKLTNQQAKILDHCLALFFPGPNSFTGEDCVEFHLHGGRAVMQSVIKAALAVDPSIRLAEAGEFSKRAVLNGKLDLTEAEAIADLVAAETEAQAELAVAQLGGALKDLYEGWRAQLVMLLAQLEAAIDFVDEEDVPADLVNNIHHDIAQLAATLAAHLDDRHLGERLRDGFTVAVIGAPNAGKSSLVNALARRDVAIVSDIAGTTRDVIEVHLNLNGFPVILVDTAGLRDSDDAIEREGIVRARRRAADADIILALFDATQEKDAATLAQCDARALTVITKSDLSPLAVSPAKAGVHGDDTQFSGRKMDPVSRHGDTGLVVSTQTRHTPNSPPVILSASEGSQKAQSSSSEILRSAQDDIIFISTTTSHNLDLLLKTLSDKIEALTTRKSDVPLLTRARHRDAVAQTRDHLLRAAANTVPELLAEDMRLATRALGRVTGRVDVEDLLDIIFRDFCIGK